MEKVIHQRLEELQMLHNIEILYACEAGSRSYQLDTNESDYDIRFIFKRDAADYLLLKRPGEVINEKFKNLDIQGWDLYKAMHLFTKSNPSLFEWLFSSVVYKEQQPFSDELRLHICDQYSLKSITLHYLQLLKANIKRKLTPSVTIDDVKVYLHIIRAYLSIKVLTEQHSLPKVVFSGLIEQAAVKGDVKRCIEAFYQAKVQGSVLERAAFEELKTYIQHELVHIQERLTALPEGNIRKQELNQFILKQHCL